MQNPLFKLVFMSFLDFHLSFSVYGSWRDTTIMASDDRVSIAFVAEQAGKWMFHCHMVEHQAAGMMAFFEVEGEKA